MFEDAEIVSSYSRADAISDGLLVDVTEVAREVGFRLPVALTRAVWGDCVAWGELERSKKKTVQDEAGRLWDVLYMAYRAALSNQAASRVEYELYRVPTEGRGVMPRLVRLAMHIGPGDQAEPVITIMQPQED